MSRSITWYAAPMPNSTSPDELIAAARELAIKVAGCADEIEEERRIPAALAGEMADAGLFRLLVPQSLGGVGLPHPAFVEIVRIFAEVDASTAWCVNQNNIFATDSTRMPEEAASAIWGDQRGIVTNGPPAKGTIAIPTEDGYRLSGHWDFSSGSSHSTWLAARAPVEGETGEPRMFLVQKAGATMIDTWQVSGLRGTASFSFEIMDRFIPESHTYLESDRPKDASPIYVIPKIPLFAIGFATITVAQARACLDDAIAIASRKQQRAVSGAMIEHSTIHRQIGETEAALRSADSYLRTSSAALWAGACERGEVSMDERVEVRMAATHAIRTSVEVVDAAFEMFGSDAIFTRNPLQRRWQDVRVIAQQVQGRRTNFETAGRYFQGLDTGTML